MNVANALVTRMPEQFPAEIAPLFANNREETRQQGSENHHPDAGFNHFEGGAAGTDVLLASGYRLDLW